MSSAGAGAAVVGIVAAASCRLMTARPPRVPVRRFVRVVGLSRRARGRFGIHFSAGILLKSYRQPFLLTT